MKAGGDEMMKAILKICKQVWQEGTIPVEWTKSILMTMPKKGDLTLCKNYRTINENDDDDDDDRTYKLHGKSAHDNSSESAEGKDGGVYVG